MTDQTPATNYTLSSQDQSGWITDGRSVEAEQGWRWITEGYALFVKAPGTWIVITALLMTIMIVLVLIPFLGQIAINLLIPVFSGGLMLGCRSLSSGGTLQITHLFEGFKQRTAELMLLAVFYLLGAVAIALIVILVAGGSMATGVLLGQPVDSAGIAVRAVIGILLALALTVPLAMATWFAIPLVVFHDVAPFPAMKTSFFACLKNVVPFLVYGAIAFVLGIISVIPLGLGFLVLIPVLVGSVYAGYRDIFFAKS
jgi:uncharacterized membrane protein